MNLCCARWQAGLVAFLLLPITTPSVAAGHELPGDVARGEYVFHLAGCAGCHTDQEADLPPLAGGAALDTPYGRFYPPNITPDPDTGIGDWSRADLARALRRGESPDGRVYFPAFPYPSYAGIREQDLSDLYAYLQSVPPVRRSNRPHELDWFLRLPGVACLWRAVLFTPTGPDRQRGAYLVNTLGHCGECHTPRTVFGALDPYQPLAGNRDGPEGEAVPNITPHRKTGIGRWSEDDLTWFLKTGETPSGDSAGSLMAEVIDNGLQYLSDQDAAAMAAYLKSIQPIDNPIGTRSKPKKEDW